MNGRILLVDDDPGMLLMLSSALKEEFELREASSGEVALEIAGSWSPDLVLLDLSLPGIDGYDVCRFLKSRLAKSPPQVVVISSRSGAEDLRLAFAAGADDYFVKPVRRCEVAARVRLHMRLRSALQAAVEGPPPPSPSDASQDVQDTQEIAVFALSKLAETRDNETGNHLNRIGAFGLRLALEMRADSKFADRIDEVFIDDYCRSVYLHDIGKVGIPDSILLNPGRLTAAEFDVMKQHCQIGAEILTQASQLSEAGGFLQMAIEIARSHHERWDGQGYPQGLAGEEIPLAARITSVVDVYDALTSHRPYKQAWDPVRARDYIIERGGSQFDPDITPLFKRCFRDLEELRLQWQPQMHQEVERTQPQSSLLLVAAS